MYFELLALISQAYGNPNHTNSENQDVINKFVRYLIEKSAVIISFNYDLVIESYLKKQNWNPLRNYGIGFYKPFTTQQYPFPHGDRLSPAILKLHGSLNWGLLPEDFNNLAAAPIYLSSSSYEEPIFRTHFRGNFEEPYRYYPYIIPPVIGKFYEHPEMRKLWHIARQAINVCSEIHVIGFSLPESDVIVEYLFRNIGPAKRKIHIVDTGLEKDPKILARFKNAFLAEKHGHEIKPYPIDAMKYLKENILREEV